MKKSPGPKSNRKMKRQREKAQKRISKMAQKGKLRKHMKDRVKAVQEKRKAASQKRRAQIHQDWLIDRRHRKAERERLSENESSNDDEEEDRILPMDMLDPDFPLDANFYKIMLAKERAKGRGENEEEMDTEEWENQVRTFVDEKELLPVKIDGKLVRRFRREKMGGSQREEEEEMTDEEDDGIKKEEIESDEDEEAIYLTEKDEQNAEELATMDDKQLAEYYKKLLAQSESVVASAVDQIIVDPQENVSKFRTLLKMAAGEGGIPELIREPIQKLTTASLAELFRNVLPGYPIHVLSETEKSQKMRKETKRLAAYEQSLLNYYVKYLKFLEKNALRLNSIKNVGQQNEESNFSTQFGFLCAQCLCKLATECAHFNYGLNIITCLVRLSLSKWQKLIDLVCSSISAVFAADLELKISLHGVKAISTLVNKKKGNVPPALISTLLSLNIKEIDQKNCAEKNKKNQRNNSKKMAAPNVPKKRRKFDKQLKKVEVELEEALATNAHATKLRLGAEVMRFVFLTFFRVLRRMPQSALLRPVLEGLTKFIHLINVEFYDDLIDHLGRLAGQTYVEITDDEYAKQGHLLQLLDLIKKREWRTRIIR